MTWSYISLFHTLTLLVAVTTTVQGSVSLTNLKKNGPTLDDYRLPGNIRPSRYDLKMRMVLDDDPNFTTFTAPSEVTMTVTCVNATDTIVLNSQFITISENNVLISELSSGTEIQIVGHSYEPDLHFYKIQTNPGLEEGKSYKIYIPFLAQILTNDTLGLYRGFYTDSITGETKNMATTFFQPFGARRMVPSFDEPEMKAVFVVEIGRLAKYHTLSNMDLLKTTEDPEYPLWYWDSFNPTVKMSPYILCVIVSDFAAEVADPNIFLGKPVKVWSTPAAIQEEGGVFAAEMGAILLNWYQNYTGIEYALPKMDSIAIPQFAAGAMENWGLNTYRDAYLIYKPGDPDSAKIGVAETLAHELSHQWFGNYATCAWWDMMWLNEGLATFFTYRSLVNLVPEFDSEMRFIFRHHQNALKFDSNPNKSHPVVIPTDGFDFFDGTSMEKGGSLTRMLEYIFTSDVLQDGLITYLKRHAFQGAVQDGLFESLEESIYKLGLQQALPDSPDGPGKVSLKDIMYTWTLQTGYPLIRVSREGKVLTLSQENIIDSQPDHLWWVPITIVTQDSPNFDSHIPTIWIPPTVRTVTYTLSDSAANGWVVINHDAVGFYRVLYDENLTKLIQNELLAHPNAFTPFTRSQMLDDWLNLGTDGSKGLTLNESIGITEYLPKEMDPGVLKSALTGIMAMIKKFEDFNHFSETKVTLVSRLEAMLKTIGLEESPEDQQGDTNVLRNDLLKALCEMKSSVCAELSTKLFSGLKNMHPKKRIPVNIQDAMYCAIVQTGGQEAWQLMHSWYTKETDTRQTKLFVKALACPLEEDLIVRALEMVENRSLWMGTNGSENRYLMLKQLINNSPMGRGLYIKSNLFTSKHPQDVKLNSKIAKIL